MTSNLVKRPAHLILSSAVAIGLTCFSMSPSASAADLEKCYGIAKAGQDDGNKEMEVPGMSGVDYQGDAFKFVTK